MHRRFGKTVVLTALAAFAAGCASSAPEERHRSHEAAGAAVELATLNEAIAVVHPTKGHACRGWVRFLRTAEGLRVTGEFEGLKPNAKHAFHIHQYGDASSGDGKSAGDHYNPEGHPHAGPDASMRHAGDLGNLETDANGAARYDRVIEGLSIADRANPVLGRAVIVHAGEDDLASQPAGNAGDRIGIGVIGVAKPTAAQ